MSLRERRAVPRPYYRKRAADELVGLFGITFVAGAILGATLALMIVGV